MCAFTKAAATTLLLRSNIRRRCRCLVALQWSKGNGDWARENGKLVGLARCLVDMCTVPARMYDVYHPLAAQYIPTIAENETLFQFSVQHGGVS